MWADWKNRQCDVLKFQVRFARNTNKIEVLKKMVGLYCDRLDDHEPRQGPSAGAKGNFSKMIPTNYTRTINQSNVKTNDYFFRTQVKKHKQKIKQTNKTSNTHLLCQHQVKY